MNTPDLFETFVFMFNSILHSPLLCTSLIFVPALMGILFWMTGLGGTLASIDQDDLHNVAEAMRPISNAFNAAVWFSLFFGDRK